MIRFYMLAFLCLQALGMSADVVKGRLVDADSGDPLPGAETTVVLEFPERTIVYDTTTDTCGVFHAMTGAMCKMGLVFNYFGYETLKQSVNIPGGNDTIDIGDLKMQMSKYLLKEVLVKAKARRFFMKGDTVVFNPEAFNLEEGARLSELLKKLPGVSIEGGVVMFNGKVVHLQMNGHKVADEQLLGLLPAEAVKDIKAYEKQSEVSEMTGMRDGNEKQVLDITIKPSFMDKWYGQTRLSAYASKNYRASAYAHYLSDKHPVHVYGRVSDNGGNNGFLFDTMESDNDAITPQRQQMGKVAYMHNWHREGVKTSYDDNWDVSFAPNHNDVYQHSWQAQQTLVSDQPSIFTRTKGYDYTHNLELPFHFDTYLHFAPHTVFYVNADANFIKSRSENTSEQLTYRGDRFSEDEDNITNSSRNRSLDESTKADLRMRYNLTHVWKENTLNVEGTIRYNDEDADGVSTNDINYYDLGTTDRREQAKSVNSRSFTSDNEALVDFSLVSKKLKLRLGYQNEYSNLSQHLDYTLDGEADLTNSGRYKDRILKNAAIARIQADLGKWYLSATTTMKNVDQHTDYLRGRLDTIAHRNYWNPYINFGYQWRPKTGNEISGHVEWGQDAPEFINCMAYVDDLNPLSVRMGNPDLKKYSWIDARLRYSLMLTKASQMLTFTIGNTHNHNPTRSVVVFNPLAGGYIYSYANVDKSDRLSFGIDYDRSLGTLFRFKNGMELSRYDDYGIKTRSSLTEPMEQYRQTNLQCTLTPQLYFDYKKLEIWLTTIVTYRDLDYSDTSMDSRDIWNYEARLWGKYQLPRWTFEASCTLYGDRGYLSDNINRDRLDITAGITWKCLQGGKGQLTLDVHDLLNQMNSYYADVTATQITESWHERFHHYLSLTFTYNFDAKAGNMRK